MTEADPQERLADLARRYSAARALTEALALPLLPEDQTVQSMPDVSPTKWHRGHTTWFFETFVLEPALPGYSLVHPVYPYIFNSYYEAVGARHPRAERGLVTRPGAAEVGEYRRRVDDAMAGIFDERRAARAGAEAGERCLDLVELGIHHEQQHQELLLMDIKHVFSCNPLLPSYRPAAGSAPGGRAPGGRDVPKPGWIEHQGGPVEIGHGGPGFAFDNESPRHVTQLAPFALADRPVTCGEWLAFIADGGYERPELWLSDGWTVVEQQQWAAPLYWSSRRREAGAHGDGPRRGTGGPDADWRMFTLGGERPVDPAEPVAHVSFYEADAFARWAGGRLPTEAEWEATAAARPLRGNLLDAGLLHPAPLIGPVAAGGEPRFFGDVWEWTSSAYSPYPGFRPAPGAVGEYNGKFMVNQYVLRGGSCVTPQDHLRATYRNFFPAAARWVTSGVRVARDL